VHPAEIKVNNAISQCRDLLTDAEYFEAFKYSDQHGEYGLAVETLADILIEKGMTPNRGQLNAIVEAFRFMNLDANGRIEQLEGR
jgi:hypothetical protein